MRTGYTHWNITTDRDNIVWLTFDKYDASTNTFSAEVMNELSSIIDTLRESRPRGLVIRSGKDSGFAAGADVEEFTQVKNVEEALAIVRRGWNTFEKLAALEFPTLALVEGFALGGGAEICLACRYRVAVDDPKTRFALPEVMLGILPGWGGVKRLPKLIGPSAALDMMLTGKSVDARRAKKLGLVDACVPRRIMDNTARMMLHEAPAAHQPALLQRFLNSQPLRGLVAGLAANKVAKRASRKHYPAPYAILDSWTRYDGDPLAVPADDPTSIGALVKHPTTANLMRIYTLQEQMKSLGKASDFVAKHVHVIGAGTMGGDIAAWCALRGLTVTLEDRTADRLAPAMKRASALFARRLRDPLRTRDANDRLIPDLAGDGVRRADVIIEAIYENLAAKQVLFARIEPIAKPGAVLATNTSSLKLADIGTSLKDPTRLVGLHFFNPVALMQLVEVVSGVNTAREWAQHGAAFVKAIDKLPLLVKDSPGFLVNRVLGPYLAGAIRMLDEGIAPETIDAAAVQFGMPMGPIELADVVGLDICAAAGQSLAGAGTNAVPRTLAALLEAKHFGKKSGQGFYRWEKDKPIKAAAAPIPDRLTERLIEPYLAEARKVVAEGVVADADAADAGLIFGTGFAPFTGGPMNYLRSREVRRETVTVEATLKPV